MQELIAKMRLNMNNSLNMNNGNGNNFINLPAQIQAQNLSSFGKNTFTLANSNYSLVNRALSNNGANLIHNNHFQYGKSSYSNSYQNVTSNSTPI